MKKPFLLFLLFLSLISCREQASSNTDPPNLLFIMMDDLGYGQFAIHNDTLSTASFDPFFMGLVKKNQGYNPEQALTFSRIAIPSMSALARNGVQFTQAFTSSNLCAPSRLGIATGILQNRLGVYRNTDCEARGLDTGSHLAAKLQEKGYATAHIGKWHIGTRRRQMLIDATRRHSIEDTLTYAQIRQRYPDIYQELLAEGYYGSVIDAHHPLQNGFDYYYGYNTWASDFYKSTLVWENYSHAGVQPGYNTDVFTDKALAFMQAQTVKQKPFYVQLHYHAVHGPLKPKAPDKYFNRFTSDSYELNNFYAHVYGVDANIQRILDYLKSVNQLDNTLIVFTSDNGGSVGGLSVLPGNAPYSGHKGNYYQGGIRVPLFFHWPKGIPRAAKLDYLASAMDILPTLIDAAGGTVPSGLDGKSLLPLLRGESQIAVHDHLVWAGLHARAWGFLLKTSYKTHVTEREFAPPAWVVIKPPHLLRYVGITESNVYHEQPAGSPARFELYNYIKDPPENRNLIGSLPGKVEELTAIYKKEAMDFPSPILWNKKKWEEIRVDN